MAVTLEEVSTLTAKGQTTVPKAVRQALGLDSGDRIAFRVDEHGVTLRRAEPLPEDPVIASFLSFLARDLERHPEALVGLPPTLADRIAELTNDVAVDLDASIEGEVDF